MSVLLLSTIPCCGNDDCIDDDAGIEQTQNQEECATTCSPFLTCGVCSGFAFNHFVFTFQVPEIAAQNVECVKDKFVENCFSRIWQPPKIVNTKPHSGLS